PALYRPDEDVTVGRAMGILHGIADPHFANWPHLYFYLAAAWLAPFHLLGLVSDQASAYLGVRALDAIFGSLTVLVVFEFGRHAYGWLAGFLAAAALTVAFLHVRVGTLAVTSPFLVLDPAVSGHGLRYIFQHLASTSAPAIGYVELAIGLWFGIDPVLVLTGLIGVGYAAFRRQPADWIVLAFLL